MTTSELRILIAKQSGSKIISILTRTVPRMNKFAKQADGTKRPNPFVGAMKVARRVGIIGADYENCVNRQRDREGLETDFQSEPLPFGRHVDRFLVEHNNKFYLKFRPSSIADESFILVDGSTVDKSILEDFLPEREGSGRQGTDKPMLWATIALESIKELKMDGQTIKVE